MPSSRLPVLPLPHPLILLPTARLTIPISRSVADTIVTLIDDSDAAQPVLAAVPIPAPAGDEASANEPGSGSTPILPTCGTAARIVRLVRPRSLLNGGNSRQPYLLSLHGLTRIKLSKPLELDIHTSELIPDHTVEYVQADGVPSRETIEAFKDAALRLLDRLAKDSAQPQRKDDRSEERRVGKECRN